jgi:hypothetical protein
VIVTISNYGFKTTDWPFGQEGVEKVGCFGGMIEEGESTTNHFSFDLVQIEDVSTESDLLCARVIKIAR